MAIKFFNIRSGETRVAETEPHITAMWASSDRSPNITQGQDFGWRLAPDVLVEAKRIAQDMNQLQIVATRMGKPLEEVRENDILAYISAKTTPENAPVASNDDYQDAYDQEVRRRTEEAKAFSAEENGEPATSAPVVEQQESLEDLQRRVELEERLAAARAITAAPEVTPATTTTTTETTQKPKTTTTTTVVK